MTDLELTFIARIALAAVLGGIIGIERDLHGRPAGLRTNMIIAVGSCLFAIISAEGFMDKGGTPDPTRIASLVVQGIGFIGAGVLLKEDMKVIGLTTASTIWLSAGVGLASGAGLMTLATFMTIFSVGLLVVLRPLSDMLEQYGNARVERQGGKVVREK